MNAPEEGCVDVWTSDAGASAPAARAAERHGLVVSVLSHYGATPEELRFRRGAYGKPRLAEPCGLHFSVSHVGGVDVVAVACAIVGVDVEPVGSRSPWATPDRAPFSWLAESADDEGSLFVERWTCFEAFTKALGCGLDVDLDVDMTWLPDGRPRLLRAGHDDVARWTLITSSLGSDAMLSLAVRTPDARLQWRDHVSCRLGDAA